MDKKKTRKLLLQKRKNISKDKKFIYDKKISNLITQSDFYKNANQVLVFASTEDEFDTNFIVEQCRTDCKKVFYPICIDNSGKMEFKEVRSSNDLQIGMYNILEPKLYCKDYKQSENDIIIVPCLSADKNGYRMGYGKGYYDRFLCKHLDVKRIGICFDFQLVDEVPTEDNDIKMDEIISLN